MAMVRLHGRIEWRNVKKSRTIDSENVKEIMVVTMTKSWMVLVYPSRSSVYVNDYFLCIIFTSIVIYIEIIATKYDCIEDFQ